MIVWKETMGPTNKEHHFHWYQYLYLLVPASRNKACDLPCTAYYCKGLDLILFVPLDLILFCAHLFFIPILIQCNLQNQTQTWPKKLTSCWTNMTEEIDTLNKHDRRFILTFRWTLVLHYLLQSRGV